MRDNEKNEIPIVDEYNEDENIENTSDIEDSAAEEQEEKDDQNTEDLNNNHYFEKLQRLKAEFLNYKRRTEKEKLNLADYIKSELIFKMLHVIDDFQRLTNHTDLEKDKLVDSINLIYNNLMAILQNEGLEPVESVGEEFDPNLHEAVLVEHNDEIENNKVLEEWRKGYLFKDKLLRPAQVKVNKTED